MSCKICGKKSGIYPLCNDCFKLRDEGKIQKCDTCGEWHYTNSPCKCTTAKTDARPISKPSEDRASELTCLICNKPSNGKHFCYSCYQEYKDHPIDIRIKNCKDVEILDRWGNKKIPCENGIRVRSLSEKTILDFLYNNNIKVVYEKEIIYQDEKGEDKLLHPDFFLPDNDNLCIEFNGLTSKAYLRSKEYTLKIYKQLGLNVLILTSEDIENGFRELKKILKIF